MELTQDQLSEYERRAAMAERERIAKFVEAIDLGPLMTKGAKTYIVGEIRNRNP